MAPLRGIDGYGYGYGYDAVSLAADIQSALSEFGFYRGTIDGVLGPRTRQAIASFQAHSGMLATGRVDQRLLVALRIG